MRSTFSGVVAAAIVAMGLLGSAPPALAAGSCLTGSVAAFSFSGSEQCYTVPAGVTSVQVVAVGAREAPGGLRGSGPWSAAGCR
ncbi:MAG TPA: hypothetical protein VFI54_26395 [Solirubrobacteraceae bacterium]|nr:hypothetical protein [Solirubrobacteraceae bacterium]